MKLPRLQKRECKCSLDFIPPKSEDIFVISCRGCRNETPQEITNRRVPNVDTEMMAT